MTSAIGTLAERLPVRSLTTSDGLPRDHLACVIGDPRGFIWFCTADGLVRFDGHTATTFGRDAGLDPPGVRAVMRATDGRFWIGADAGLYEFAPATDRPAQRFTRIARDDGAPSGAVNSLAESRDHTIWCASGRGLLRIDRTSASVRVTEVDIGLPRDSENDQIVRAVLEDEDGTLWIGAGSGLYRRRPDGRAARLTTADGLPVDEVWALAIDSTGRLWAATRMGLCLIDRSAREKPGAPVVRRVFTHLDGLPARNIKSLLADRDGLWVGTVVGVAQTVLTSEGTLRVTRSLTGFFAWAIATDARGDTWVATDSGARRISRRGFATYLPHDGLAAPQVSALFESRSGDVCATTLVGRFELSCFNGSMFRRLPIRAVQSLSDPGWGWSQLTLQDRRGRWWIPTGEGLLQFAAGPPDALMTAAPTARYDVRNGLRSNSVFRLFEDGRGGVWAATFAESGNGLARIDSYTGVLKVFGEKDGLPDDLPIVHAFAEDRTGAIWIGLEQGRLLRYRGSRFEEVRLPAMPKALRTTVSFDHLRALLVDRQGRLWIASSISGLGRVDDPSAAAVSLKWYGTKQGLSSDTAWALVEHASGDLFVGSARGVDRFSPATERVVHYSADEGVPRAEIWGALRDRSGRIWFATNDGAARLADGDDAEPPPPPITLVTAVRISGVPAPISADGATRVDAIALEPGDRRIEIDFVSPGARAADGLLYQYQLEGVDRDWTTTETRTVALAGAAAGRYRFLVRATLASGLVGDPARVEFSVLAPFWRRPWFIAAVVACVGALAFAFHRTRVTRLVEVERVRSRIAADLHDGVGASLSRIAIVSEVVRRQAESALPDAVPALASIGDSARELVDDMGDAVWFIDPRLDNLQQIVVRVRAVASGLFDDRGVAWTLEAPDDAAAVALTPEQRRHVYLILKESLTNVLRHAQASRVEVHIGRSGRRLRIEVTDDGVGVNAERLAATGGGRGLINMRARAEALRGTLSIGPGANARGTRIVLEAPAT